MKEGRPSHDTKSLGGDLFPCYSTGSRSDFTGDGQGSSSQRDREKRKILVWDKRELLVQEKGDDILVRMRLLLRQMKGQMGIRMPYLTFPSFFLPHPFSSLVEPNLSR